MGVVHSFPTVLGTNPIQASKHQSVLTISRILKINVYTDALKCLTAVIGNVHISECPPYGGGSILDPSGKGFVHLTAGF